MYKGVVLLDMHSTWDVVLTHVLRGTLENVPWHIGDHLSSTMNHLSEVASVFLCLWSAHGMSAHDCYLWHLA